MELTFVSLKKYNHYTKKGKCLCISQSRVIRIHLLIRHRMLTLCNNHPIFHYRGIFTCLIISVVALLAIILVYSTVPGLWNAHNKVLILYVSTFLSSFLLIIVRKLTLQSVLEHTFWCKVIGTYSNIVLKITLKVRYIMDISREKIFFSKYFILGYSTYLCTISTFCFMSVMAVNLTSTMR